MALRGKTKSMPGEVRDLVRKIRLFSNLREEEIGALAQAFSMHHVAAGRMIFNQDDPADRLYLIVEGKVRIVRKGESGREAVLAILGEGNFFGEMALFTGEPRSAAAVAMEPTSLLVLKRADFLEAVRAFPEIGLGIMEEMGRRLLQADKLITSLLWDSAYRKIVLSIRRLAAAEGSPRAGALVIKRRVTHQELADMAGISRETASRFLAFLKKTGAVVTSGRNLIVRNAAVPPRFQP